MDSSAKKNSKRSPSSFTNTGRVRALPIVMVHRGRRERVADSVAVDRRIMCSPNVDPTSDHGCATAIARVLHARAMKATRRKSACAGQCAATGKQCRKCGEPALKVMNAAASAAQAALRVTAQVHAAANSVASAWIATTTGGAAKPEIAMTTTTTIARLAPATAIAATNATTTKTTRPHRPFKLSR